MTLNKKNWLKLSLLGLLVAIGTGGSCAEDTVPEEETPTTLFTVYEGREIKIGNLALEIAQMTKSGDNKFIYTRSIDNKALYAHKVGAKTAAPVALTIASKPADPPTFGKADLSGATTVAFLIPTDKGVMGSVCNDAKNGAWGVALFEADETTADTTWITNKDDDIYSAGNSVGNRTDPTYGFMVYKMDGTLAKQAPYIFSPAKSGFFTVDGPSALGTKLANISTRATPLSQVDYIIGHKASGSAYMIDNLGLARIAPSNVNGATNNTNIPLAEADGTGDDVTKKGLKNFKKKRADGSANLVVNDQGVIGITILGDKLYLAFKSTEAMNGGVAVVDLNPTNGELGTVHAPSHTWISHSVLHLTKDGNKVYAVATYTPTGATDDVTSIFEVTATADKGPELSDWLNAKTAGTANKAIAGDIKFVELAGNELYVATATGFFNITKKTVAK